MAKIKTEVKDIKKQLLVIHLSLINEVRHSEKSYLSISTPFQHKYPFQNQKNKNPPPLYDIKTQKEVWEKSTKKSPGKAEKEEEGDGV